MDEGNSSLLTDNGFLICYYTNRLLLLSHYLWKYKYTNALIMLRLPRELLEEEDPLYAL